MRSKSKFLHYLVFLLVVSAGALIYFLHIFYPHMFGRPSAMPAEPVSITQDLDAVTESDFKPVASEASIFEKGIYADTRATGLTFMAPETWRLAATEQRSRFETRSSLQSPDFNQIIHEDSDFAYAELKSGAEITVSTFWLPGSQTIADIQKFNSLGRDTGPVLTNEQVVRIQGKDALLYDGTSSSDSSLWHRLDILNVLQQGPTTTISLVATIQIHYKTGDGKAVFNTILDTLIINNHYAEWTRRDGTVYFRGVALSHLDAATFAINDPGYYGECGSGPSVRDKNGYYIPKDFYLYNFNDPSKYIFERVTEQQLKQFYAVEGCG